MTDIPPTQLRGAVDLSSLLRQPSAGTGAKAAASVTVASLVVEGSDANFGQLLELSSTVPVVVELYAGAPSSALERVILGYAGRLVLARVDARVNPQLTQAFQAVAAPTVAAVIDGKPIALYEGELAETEAKSVFDQVLTLAGQNGVAGVATQADAPAIPDTAEPVEEPLPPHHQEAFDAIDRGDYSLAITEYRAAIAQDPRDQLAIAGLAQVSLLDRLSGTIAEDLRAAAAAQPGGVDAQLAVADLDVAGGHLDDAFSRLLDLFVTLDQPGKDAVRERLLSYFEIAGAEDPRVAAARKKLTSLLY
ncbi:MAG: tetratricopeptide repeat protein [Microbacteriaceae bacterium]|nr:tetratricopeptide repeat protein [Microbacteriaceae bacterium]